MSLKFNGITMVKKQIPICSREMIAVSRKHDENIIMQNQCGFTRDAYLRYIYKFAISYSRGKLSQKTRLNSRRRM